MQQLDDFALMDLIQTARKRRKGKLMDAKWKAEAEAAEAELSRRVTPYLEALAQNPCDPERYFGQSKRALEFKLFALKLMEDWHDVYGYAIREESWFVRHFLHALERKERAAARPNPEEQDAASADVLPLPGTRTDVTAGGAEAHDAAYPPSPPSPNQVDALIPLPIPGGPVYPYLERDEDPSETD